MIPASYLYRDIFNDHWGNPRNPAPAAGDERHGGGPGHPIRTTTRRLPLPLLGFGGRHLPERV